MSNTAGGCALPLLSPEQPIVTQRLVLRPMLGSDIAAVVEYRSHPEVFAYMSHGGDRARLEEEFRQRVAQMEETPGEASGAQLVIEQREADADQASSSENHPGVVGDCGFRIARAWTKDGAPTCHLVARIHYALDDTTAGQGYGTEAVDALVRYLFAQPDVHRIQADVFAENTASRHMLEKVGFRQEGYFVDDGLIDGCFVDACLYSLLRREWEAVSPA